MENGSQIKGLHGAYPKASPHKAVRLLGPPSLCVFSCSEDLPNQRIIPTYDWQEDSLPTVPPGQLLPTDPQYQNVICCCEIFNTGTLAIV